MRSISIGLDLPPLIGLTAADVSHALDVDRGVGVDIFRLGDGFFLRRCDRARSLRVRLADREVSLFAFFDEEIIVGHWDPHSFHHIGLRLLRLTFVLHHL